MNGIVAGQQMERGRCCCLASRPPRTPRARSGVSVDSTAVRAHQHAAGARKAPTAAVVGVQVHVHHLVRRNVRRLWCGDGVETVSLLLSVRGGREATGGGPGSTSVAGVEAVSSAV
jgi:hypothetical protein